MEEKTTYAVIPTPEERVSVEWDYQNLEDPVEADKSTEEEEGLDMSLFSTFKAHSMILGLVIGFFVQFSSLGANILVFFTLENDVDLLVWGLWWSIFTVSVLILTFKSWHAVVLNVVQASTIIPTEQRQRSTALLEHVVVQLECRFAAGSIVGVCSASAVMDFFLGRKLHTICSLVTLGVSLIAVKVMLHFRIIKEEDHPLVKDKKPKAKVIMV